MSNKKKLATDIDKEVKKMGSRLEKQFCGCLLSVHTHTHQTNPPKKSKLITLK